MKANKSLAKIASRLSDIYITDLSSAEKQIFRLLEEEGYMQEKHNEEDPTTTALTEKTRKLL